MLCKQIIDFDLCFICCRNCYRFLLNGQTRKEKSSYHKL